jgi:asparagine synthase (glutamine-hydrolysing)
MCGIAGFYGPFDMSRLAGMARAMSHRGPDDEGLELKPGVADGENVGFAHRRLAIIDLSTGHQPMWSSNGQLGIVFNGEIYNYQELRRELLAEGADFRTHSDTEVILEGWRLRGEKILSALGGMFAFGLWDSRTREWVLARDRWGIKPLYYGMPAPGQLVFASEIKPLLPFLPRVEPNVQAIYEYLLYSWTPGPASIFAGIDHLPPGHVVRWKPGDKSVQPKLYVDRSVEPIRISREEAARVLRDKFDRAVEAHLVADVPVGVNLSGGLDSSAVVASMARLRAPASIEAFTVGFGLSDDETPFATEMARYVGVNHHTRTVSPERVAQDFATIVRTIEEPIGHPVMQTTYEAARFAREQLKVVLIGEGSDELFLGYPQYRLLQSPIPMPRSLRQKLYLAVTCLMPPPGRMRKMLAPGFLDRDLFDAAEHRFDKCFLEGDARRRAQAFEIAYPLVANQLMRIDKLTMAHSLEARVPFLDNELGAFARSLPFERKLDGRRTKAVLRDAMHERLPNRILHRPKTGKGGTQALLPYLDGLVRGGPLSHLVARDAIARRGWLDPDHVLGYLAEAKTFAVRHHPVERRRRTKFAYSLAVLEQWAREYLD